MSNTSYLFPSVTYPSPLAGYEDAPPLPDEKNEDGKSYKNPQTGVLSPAYERFPEPLDNGRRGGLYVQPFTSPNPPSLPFPPFHSNKTPSTSRRN
jgi:DOPA 4,5-dioxygenase